MGEAQKRKPVESTGNVMDIFLYRYDSVSDAARAVGDYKNNDKIVLCCKGKRKHFAGRRWRYAEG